ncbi:MAG: hypothetical protein WCZ43_04710 [Proteiniphilum sp.]
MLKQKHIHSSVRWSNIYCRMVTFILIGLGICFVLGNCSKEIGKQKHTTYYVDTESGNNINEGTSEDFPWKTLQKIEKTQLYPGDTVRFKRGASFIGPLYITNSGDSLNHITLSDYGDSQLPAPAFTNPVFDEKKGNFGNCIRIQGSYIVVENLYCHHTAAQLPENTGGFTTMWELGAIYIDKQAEYCIIRNNELFDCGVGIKSYGRYTLIENNFIHDCNRVLKEWNWGPIGIWIGSDYQEVCHNRIFNYKVIDPRISWGPNSYGGGADGGAIEIDDARINKSNISIHHNYTRDCQGFLEVTWSDVQQNPKYTDFAIHHNISDDFQQFIALWCGAECRIENNTIIRRKVNVNDWGVFNITQQNSKNFIRNNIIVVENDVVIFNVGKNGNAQPDNIIENNLYYAASGTLNMGKEGPGSMPIFGNPLFLNYRENAIPEDFSITGKSMAIERGLELGYKTDFSKTKIPQGKAPDVGAFEFCE